MRLLRLQVRNFRCLKDVELTFGNMTSLIGANGSGKSALLRALAAFYDEGDLPVAEDWYGADTATELEVVLTFKDLSQDELDAFRRYVTPEGHLSVARVWWLEGDRVRNSFYGYHFACSDFQAVRTADRGIRELHKLLVESGKYPGLQLVTRAEDSTAALEEWETANPGRCAWIRDGGKFFGWQQVGGSKLAQSSICVYVPAVRDARADAGEGKGSVLSRIVDLVIRGELARSPDLVQLREETQEKFGKILSSTRPVLQDVAKDLTSLVARFSPGAEVLLDWKPAPAALPDWPSIEARLLEDGVDSPVFAKGHGLQRSFIVSLLQRLAELLSMNEVSGPEGGSRHTLLLIEEPELYQHPLAARRFAAVLRQLAEGVGNTQVAYSTHHRDFVSFDHFDSIRRVGKALGPPGVPPATTVRSLGIRDVREALVRLWNLNPDTVTDETTRQRLQTVMTPEVSEGFFARKVVLVEGEQDRAMIEGCADVKAIDLVGQGVAVLPVGGKSSLDRAMIVFSGFGIPTYLVWDGDAMAATEEETKQNRVLLQLAGLEVTDFPGTTIGESATVFENEIETELHAALGDEYEPVLKKAAQLVDIHKGRDLLKTWYGCKAFVSLVREAGGSLGALEDLVDRLGAWAAE